MPGRSKVRDSGDHNEEDDKKSRKKSSKFNYGFGTRYPGVVIGHRACNPFATGGYNVPNNMGWLWNAPDMSGLKPRRGWRPGAVGKSMQKVMTFKLPRGRDQSRAKDTKKKRPRRDGGATGGTAGDVYVDSEPDEPLDPKPALKINRKGDIYTIQVNPLKDLNRLREHEDPYVDCDPLIFKIVKKRSPEQRAMMEAKKLIKEKKKRDTEIRKQLAEAVEDICKCAYMDVYCNDYTAIDKTIESCPAFAEPECVCKSESMSSLSSNATWDIEYTPPFGCFDTHPKKIKNFVHVETQYTDADAGADSSSKAKGSSSTKGKKKKK